MTPAPTPLAAPDRRGAAGTAALTAILAVALLIGGCAPTAAAGPPELVGELNDRRISEASGLVASRRYPGLYYTHNDSGDSARVFVIDERGRTHAVITLEGVKAVDFEDIALAPGAESDTFDICVADIGDNNARRRNVAIHRFPEPDLPANPASASARDDDGNSPTTLPAERTPPADPERAPVVRVRPVTTTLRYEQGPQDAEALVVDPWTGDGYILTKRIDGQMRVYHLPAPWPAEGEVVLSLVRTVALPPATLRGLIVTAADLSPDGTRLAVRCYLDGWQWRRPARGSGDEPAGAAAFLAFFDEQPDKLPLAVERQGEALAYTADGAAVLTVSEGREAPLWRVELPR